MPCAKWFTGGRKSGLSRWRRKLTALTRFPLSYGLKWANWACWVSLWARNLAVLACLIWRILLRLKRLRGRLPLFLCPTVRIRTCV